MWAGDEGGLLVGNHSAELATTSVEMRPRAALRSDEYAIAVRLASSGELLYIAAGPCTDLFLAMFTPMPWFQRESVDARETRRCIRELVRDIEGFTTTDGLESIPEFFHTYVFPVELTTDDDMSDTDSNG